MSTTEIVGELRSMIHFAAGLVEMAQARPELVTNKDMARLATFTRKLETVYTKALEQAPPEVRARLEGTDAEDLAANVETYRRAKHRPDPLDDALDRWSPGKRYPAVEGEG